MIVVAIIVVLEVVVASIVVVNIAIVTVVAIDVIMVHKYCSLGHTFLMNLNLGLIFRELRALGGFSVPLHSQSLARNWVSGVSPGTSPGLRVYRFPAPL